MHVTTWTLRGCGVEEVSGDGKVTPDALHVEVRNTIDREHKVSGRRHRVDIRLGSAKVSIWDDEVRAIVEFLRSKGVEIDPMREKQCKVARALWQSLRLPEAAGEAADYGTEDRHTATAVIVEPPDPQCGGISRSSKTWLFQSRAAFVIPIVPRLANYPDLASFFGRAALGWPGGFSAGHGCGRGVGGSSLAEDAARHSRPM
jgi:hypothetical protein